MTDTPNLTIVRLGHRGDGIAEDGTFVPFTLAGEAVAVERDGERGRLVEVLSPSPDRIPPVCRHFGRCGGCALQHMAPDAYLAFKRELVVTALAQRGLEADVDPVVPAPLRSRRRAVFALRRQEGETRLGYHARLSHDLVAIEECPILVPEIERLIPGLARLMPKVMAGGEGTLTVLATETGLDLALQATGIDARADALARIPRVTRLTVNGELRRQHAAPMLAFGRARVMPPAGGFVQAVAAAERAMADLVREGIGKARAVADLFAGSGTFSLRLAEGARVTAYEGDRAALAALDEGRRATQGLKPVRAEARDLFRNPVRAGALDAHDAIVFDPPRAGAQAQSAEIARSRVARVVGVSCNPATFARDARILVDGGYRLTRVVPVDQFLYSPHIELVGTFER